MLAHFLPKKDKGFPDCQPILWNHLQNLINPLWECPSGVSAGIWIIVPVVIAVQPGFSIKILARIYSDAPPSYRLGFYFRPGLVLYFKKQFLIFGSNCPNVIVYYHLFIISGGFEKFAKLSMTASYPDNSIKTTPRNNAIPPIVFNFFSPAVSLSFE